MSTTIQSLELEIKSSSQGAVSGLEALTSTLEKLKTVTKGGLGLTTVANQLTKVSTAVNNLGDATQKIYYLGRAIERLSNVSKISPNISKQINNISSAMKGLNNANISTTSGKIADLSKSLQPLASLPKLNITSSLKELGKLPETFNKIKSVNMTEFTAKIKELAKAMKPLANEMAKISSGFSALPSKMNKVMASTEKLPKSNAKASKSYVDFYARMKMVAGAIKTIGNAIFSYISKSNDYIENLNLFNVSLGKYADEAQTYAETVGEVMGIDPSDWMRNQGIFMTLGTGFGVASEDAYTMSKNLTQLGYDISSFYNIDVEEAMQKLQSGISGELEPLRRLGYDLSQAQLEAIALSLGIDKSVSSMTQAEKAYLRYYAIMTQVTQVQGDMSRTLDAPANQIRILKAQVEQLARSIGNIFIPILNKVLPYVIALTKVVRELANVVSSLMGFTIPEVDYSGVEGIATGADDATESLDDTTESVKNLKNHMMGFDELNVISQDTSSDDVGSGAFDFELPTYDFIGEATENRVTELVTQIKDVLGVTNELGTSIGAIFENLAQGWTEGGGKELLYEFKGLLKDIVGLIGDIIGSIAEWLAEVDLSPLITAFDNLIEGLRPVIDTIGGMLIWLLDNVIKPVLTWITEILAPEVTDAITSSLGALVNILGPVFEGIKTIFTALEPVISWILNTVIGVIQSLADRFDFVGERFGSNGAVIQRIFTAIGEIITNVWAIIEPIFNLFGELISNVMSGASTEIDDLLSIIVSIVEIFSGVVEFISGVLTGDWDKAWNGIRDIFYGIWSAIYGILIGIANGIIGAVEGLINGVISLINGITWGINQVTQIVGIPAIPAIPEVSWGRLSTTTGEWIQPYAEGGFPTQGQLFIANEAGAEMIGTIGHRTAVANNDQIVEGISSGVAQANSEQNILLREQNALLRQLVAKDSGVYLDGRSLTNSVEKYQQERGRVLITGGVL